MTSTITVGLNGDGGGGSKVLMLKPPGGDTHFTNIADAESDTDKIFNRVLRPPGGVASDIFGSDSCGASTSGSENGDAESNKKPYRMASNFELGDEQPTIKPKRHVVPSVNPLTGEIMGQPRDKRAEAPLEQPPSKAGRVPPGGFSTPLW